MSVGNARSIFDDAAGAPGLADTIIQLGGKIQAHLHKFSDSVGTLSLHSLRLLLNKTATEQRITASHSTALPGDIRIHCISDTHNRFVELDPEKIDLLIHCGDLTEAGTMNELVRTLYWLDSLPISHKIFIGGNHDICLEHMDSADVKRRWPSLIYLYDTRMELSVKGQKMAFFGTPRTPRYGGFTAFAYAPQDTPFARDYETIDILVSHGPPYGYVDKIGEKHVGCRLLRDFVRRAKPHLVVCGHIHVAGGSVDYAILDELEEARHETTWLSTILRVCQNREKPVARLHSTVFANCAIADSSSAKSGMMFFYRKSGVE